jgi:hypothetical protein
MANQVNESPSSERQISRLFRFTVPETKDVEVYMVRLPDGRIVARTAEELREVEHESPSRPGPVR